MQVTVPQEALKEALSLAGKSVASRSTLPVLGNFLLRAQHTQEAGGEMLVAATNLEISTAVWIGAEVSNPGAITVPAGLFAGIVSQLPPDPVEMELNVRTQTLHLRCGQFTAEIKGIDAADYPNFPEYDKIEDGVEANLPTDIFRSLVDGVTFAASSDQSRPTLTGVEVSFHEGRLAFAATDGYRLAIRSEDADATEFHKGGAETAPASKFTIIVPATALTEVSRQAGTADPALPVGVRVAASRNQVLFRMSGKSGKTPSWLRTTVSAQLIDAKYPDYKAIIPKTSTTTAVLDTAAVAKAVRLAHLFAKDNANTIHMQIQPPQEGAGDGMGIVSITATSAEAGTNTTDLPTLVEGPAVDIALNAKYLLETFGTITEPQVRLAATAPTRPIDITAPGRDTAALRHIIMPMQKPR